MFVIDDTKIQITRGDTGIFSVSLTDEEGEPYDLQEGDTLRFTVRKSPTSGDIFIQKSDGPEVILSPEDTAKLSYGKYVYDIELTKADGTVDTVVPPATFEILPEVTY